MEIHKKQIVLDHEFNELGKKFTHLFKLKSMDLFKKIGAAIQKHSDENGDYNHPDDLTEVRKDIDEILEIYAHLVPTIEFFQGNNCFETIEKGIQTMCRFFGISGHISPLDDAGNIKKGRRARKNL